MDKIKSLRFAPLIRVSTESQARRGESLNTQKTQIAQIVDYLSGSISSWKYCGQEHATPNRERKKLDELLADANKGMFDAVIVCDASRWSRDNSKSKEGLQILRDNDIKFFVGSTEYDLYSPEHAFFLGMSSEIGEFQANQQNLKSTLNRIERAKRNIPTAGELPFGRTFDRATGDWGIDEEKKHNIENAAKEYLGGMSLKKIALRIGMDYGTLLKTLKDRCGNTWELTFDVAKFKIYEKITLNIPPLLSTETIQAIHEKAEANKTYTHGQGKNKYLLGRMIFCKHCGESLSGQFCKPNKYYRHRSSSKCKNFHSIRADIIEDAVMVTLFKMFGDKVRMEKAAKDAIPDKERITGLHESLTVSDKALEKIKTEKRNILKSIAKGIVSDDEVTEILQEIRSREALISADRENIKSRLEGVPTQIAINRKIQLTLRVMEGYYRSPSHFENMTFDEKRTLLQSVFVGKDHAGKRHGVYVEIKNGKRTYTIKGNLVNETDYLPMSDAIRDAILGIHEKTSNHNLDRCGPSRADTGKLAKL